MFQLLYSYAVISMHRSSTARDARYVRSSLYRVLCCCDASCSTCSLTHAGIFQRCCKQAIFCRGSACQGGNAARLKQNDVLVRSPKFINKKMANCSSHELLTICRTCLPAFDFINVAAALHRIAKLRCSVEAEALLPALCDKAVCSIASGSFQAQGSANTGQASTTTKSHGQLVLAMTAEVWQTCIVLIPACAMPTVF
eukprot:s4305_g7.t1